MTSRVSCFKMIINGMKRHLWYGAVCFVAFFIGLPLSGMLRFQSVSAVSARIANPDERLVQIQKIKEEFQIFVGAGDYFVMTLVLLAALLGAWSGLCWLHSRKKMDMMGALPVRREKLLFTESVSMLFLFGSAYAANLILAVLVGASRGIMSGKAAALGLAGMAIHLFFYLVLYLCAAAAMVLTGKVLTGILGTLVFLAIGPITSSLISEYQSIFLKTYVSGEKMLDKAVRYLSPAGNFMTVTRRMNDSANILVLMLIAAAVGLAFAVLSFWLIKIRRAEGAEQSMAFPKTEGIIKACILYPIGLGGGLFFYELGGNTGAGTNYFWLWFGICFTLFLTAVLIEVIYHLDRKRIFEHKLYTGAAAAVVLLTVACFVFDLTGYDTRLPKKENLKAAAALCPAPNWYNYPDGSGDNHEYIENHMDEFPIDTAYELAEAGVRDLSEKKNTSEVTVVFQSKSGKITKRKYQIPEEEIQKAEKELYQNERYKEAVFPLLFEDPQGLGDVTMDLKGECCTLEELTLQEKQELFSIYQKELKTLSYEEITALEYGIFEFRRDDRNGMDYSSYEYGGVYPVNENFRETMAFLRGKGCRVTFPFEKEKILSLRFFDYRSPDEKPAASGETKIIRVDSFEKNVMKDPAQIAEAVENLVWMHWDFIGTARLDRRLDVEVEYVTDSGEVTSCSGVYEYEKIPEIVEEFLRK